MIASQSIWRSEGSEEGTPQSAANKNTEEHRVAAAGRAARQEAQGAPVIEHLGGPLSHFIFVVDFF